MATTTRSGRLPTPHGGSGKHVGPNTRHGPAARSAGRRSGCGAVLRLHLCRGVNGPPGVRGNARKRTRSAPGIELRLRTRWCGPAGGQRKDGALTELGRQRGLEPADQPRANRASSFQRELTNPQTGLKQAHRRQRARPSHPPDAATRRAPSQWRSAWPAVRDPLCTRGHSSDLRVVSPVNRMDGQRGRGPECTRRTCW